MAFQYCARRWPRAACRCVWAVGQAVVLCLIARSFLVALDPHLCAALPHKHSSTFESVKPCFTGMPASVDAQVLYHGALAASGATFVGHYPWCARQRPSPVALLLEGPLTFSNSA